MKGRIAYNISILLGLARPLLSFWAIRTEAPWVPNNKTNDLQRPGLLACRMLTRAKTFPVQHGDFMPLTANEVGGRDTPW